MRPIGGYVSPEEFPAWPDYINTVLPTTIGSVVAFDYPAASTAASSAPAYCAVVSQNLNVWFNPTSTGANVPTSNALAGQAGQTLVSNAVPFRTQIPAGSTGGSVAFPTTAGGVSIRFWRK